MHAKRSLIPLLTAAVLLVSTGTARVHPHIFAEARLDVVVDANREVSALRHLWRFDDLFSSTVLLEFDANKDLKLDQAELDEVGKTVHDSLAEFNYFQVVMANGKDVDMTPPDRLIATLEDNQLIILFEAKPKVPIPLNGKLDVGVYDPTFYTAIDFVEDTQLAVDNMPAGCRRQVIRPNPDDALAANQSTLTDAFFNDPTGTDMSKIFATRLELDCSAQG